MERGRYAVIAEAHRQRLVDVSEIRGHDLDTAEDLAQTVIILGLDKVRHFQDEGDVRRELNRLLLSRSGKERQRVQLIAERCVRLDEKNEELLAQHDDEGGRDRKIDVGQALEQLSEMDRELARFILIEGWTYEEVLPLFSDVFTSRSDLYRYVSSAIVARLRALLADYRKER